MPLLPPSSAPSRSGVSQRPDSIPITPEAHRALGRLLAVLLVALPAMFIGEWLGTALPAELTIFAVMSVWIALLAVAHRRGRDRLVIGGLIVIMLGAAGLFGLTFGSVRTVGTIALPGAIVVAGIFLGVRAIVATLLGCSAVVGGLIAVQNLGWLVAPNYDVRWVHWFEYTVVLATIAVSVWFARRATIDATRRAVTGEAWLQTVLRSAPFALIVSALEEERILEINAACERMFRLRREDAVGRNSVQLQLWPDLSQRQQLLDQLQRDGRVSQMPLQLRRADGEIFDALFSIELIDSDGKRLMVATVADVSEELRARRAQLQSEARFRKLFDETPVATLITTYPEGRISACNDALAAVIGVPRASILGRTVVGMKLWADPSEREAAFERLQREGAVRDQPLRLRRADGGIAHCLLNWVFIDSEGERFILGQFVDLSARLEAEQALRELNERLEDRVRERTAALEASNAALAEARDAAEAAASVKSQFLANMSHEIRTPLNAVVGLTDLVLQKPELTTAVAEPLRKVRTAGLALLDIVSRILDFSKIEAGRLQVEREPFALDQVLESLRAVIGVAAEAKGLGLRIELPQALPRMRLGDALRLTQVLTNLAGNAIKFTATGGVTIELGEAPAASDASACVRFAVHDSGIGIAPDKLHRLFQPFDQIDSATTRRFGGTGLGLAIARELVRLMGGEIEVRSEEGRGSSFMFTLPLPLVPDDAAAPAPVPAAAHDDVAAPASLSALRGCRILLAEDNEVNQLVARGFLEEQAGAQLRVVATGAEVLEALRSERFDLVLMDVQMPVMDGYEATRRLRQDPRLATLPVIAMTAHAQPSDRARSLAAGMDGHIVKPFMARELFDTLAAALQRSRR